MDPSTLFIAFGIGAIAAAAGVGAGVFIGYRLGRQTAFRRARETRGRIISAILADGSVTQTRLADGAVTLNRIAAGAIKPAQTSPL